MLIAFQLFKKNFLYNYNICLIVLQPIEISQTMEKLPETINFPGEEDVTLKRWKEKKVFENCLKQSKGKPRYSFYDGPPFATGMPHYGHLLTGTIKDIVTRYAHQCGYHVERRFGWDTHGLPVEYEIDKKLGIKGPEDVMKMGIANYNKECRGNFISFKFELCKIKYYWLINCCLIR